MPKRGPSRKKRLQSPPGKQGFVNALGNVKFQIARVKSSIKRSKDKAERQKLVIELNKLLAERKKLKQALRNRG